MNADANLVSEETRDSVHQRMEELIQLVALFEKMMTEEAFEEEDSLQVLSVECGELEAVFQVDLEVEDASVKLFLASTPADDACGILFQGKDSFQASSEVEDAYEPLFRKADSFQVLLPLKDAYEMRFLASSPGADAYEAASEKLFQEKREEDSVQLLVVASDVLVEATETIVVASCFCHQNHAGSDLEINAASDEAEKKEFVEELLPFHRIL